MTTFGYVLILIAALMFRAISRGRVLNIGEDLSDAFLAILTGESDKLSEVVNRTGDSNKAQESIVDLGTVTVKPSGAPVPGGDQGVINTTIVDKALALGSAAKGYRFGSAGPDYYDCSGLMYRAVQAAGYKGPRFFTGTVAVMPGMQRGNGVMRGDFVVWPGHHMGVVTEPGKFYSARSVRSGIGYANIQGFRPENPIYIRFAGR